MKRQQALGSMGGIALALALVGAGCASSQQSGPDTADDADTVEASDEAEEEAMMADIDNYLDEEGEGVDQADEGGEDAADDAEDRPQSTPQERTDEIYALIKAKRSSVADCYKAAKQKDPKIGTRIAVTIVINPDGTLKGDPVIATERSNIENEQVRTCAIDVVKSVKFPAHPKGMETTFTYPFGF